VENEELITVLSYLNYIERMEPNLGGIEIFAKTDRLSCRISNKAGVTAFLNSLESSQKKKSDFLESIDKVKYFIDKIEVLLQPGNASLADSMNDLINVKNTRAFSRTMQDFYLLWLCFKDVPLTNITTHRKELVNGYKTLLHKIKNTANVTVDDAYFEQFNKDLSSFMEEYSV
jgi:hypothetical protein